MGIVIVNGNGRRRWIWKAMGVVVFRDMYVGRVTELAT